MPAGRPTTYSPEMVEKAKHYLENYSENGDVIPSAASLCLYLKCSRATLYNWGEAHPEFLDILNDVQTTQEAVLLNNGLGGSFNSNITKLALGKHGYHDKQDLNATAPLNVTISADDSKLL